MKMLIPYHKEITNEKTKKKVLSFLPAVVLLITSCFYADAMPVMAAAKKTAKITLNYKRQICRVCFAIANPYQNWM